ncbi:enoyl-CoA hydratase-related protein [Rhodocista pekingensis]|uniref:Enoyl-CoA hydratase-related protein n=1 Tax=Rhodocista pekingensis TaxID=201185 RepID=A0ABW2KYY6_9PROT
MTTVPSTTGHVLVEDADGIRSITLNRPDKRNALTVEIYETLAAALADADRADGVRVVLIAGAGGAFTGGNDLKDFLNNPPIAEDSAVSRFLQAIATCAVPIVAAVEGPAVGVGTTMLLHCDLVYATPDARLHLPFIDLGLVPEAGSSLLLPKLIGHQRAAQMLMLGEPLSGEQAAAVGLVNAVVPSADLLATARAKAAALAAKPPGALRRTKALMRGHDREAVLATMATEGRIFGELLRSPEAVAAFQAFFMKAAAKG